MSKFLHRLGRFSYRNRRAVLVAWVAALVLLGVGSRLAGGSFSSSFSIPGTESQRAMELLQKHVPGAGVNAASGQLVFAAPQGQSLTGSARAAVGRTIAQVAVTSSIASVSDPFTTGAVSADQRVAVAQVTAKVAAGDVSAADHQQLDDAEGIARAAGLQVALGGTLAQQPGGGDGTEVIGVLVALFVLMVTFGSVVAAGLPLVTAGVGVGAGILGISLLSAFTNLSSAVTTLALMLGLAVGIDYALLIISRHRTQMHEGMDPETSVALAVATSGSAVVFAGLTVVIALAALVTTGVPFMGAMGLTAAGTVALAVVIALTLVAALLGFAGRRAVKGKRLDSSAANPGARTGGARWVDFVARRRIAGIAVPVVITLALALPVLHLHLGMPNDATAGAGTQQRQAYDIMASTFGPGSQAQLTVVAELDTNRDARSVADNIRNRLATFAGVVAVAEPVMTPDGSLAILSVTPSTGPAASQTEDLVSAIRADEAAIRTSTGAQLYVTGQTAVNIDVAKRMGDALLPYLAVVEGLALLVLMIAFGSLLIPLTAIGGFLLSIAAALGTMVAVFQDGVGAGLFGVAPAPIVGLLPILIIGIVFGLAMDYQVFIVSRMREAHMHGADDQAAVHDGFQHSARVVTAAGLIMTSVFAGFILPDDPIVKSIGFAMTVGILIDALLIRMTLIPALMSVLGRSAWWFPRWLDKITPNVDIEGASVERPGQAAA